MIIAYRITIKAEGILHRGLYCPECFDYERKQGTNIIKIVSYDWETDLNCDYDGEVPFCYSCAREIV